MSNLEKQTCLKNYLIKCCYHYYVKCIPITSDFNYDQELKRLEKMEIESGEFDEDSPTHKIWGERDDQYPDWVKEGT